MKTQQIEVFSDATNASVVRMPGRKYPGLVLQSDALVALDGASRAIGEYAAKTGDQELVRLVSRLQWRVEEMLESYKDAVASAGPWNE